MKDTPKLSTRQVDFKASDDTRIDPADWVARAQAVRQALAVDGLADTEMLDGLNAFRFTDDSGRTWTYNGAAWMSWDGAAWAPGTPPGALRLQPFKLDWMDDVPEAAPIGVKPLEDDRTAPVHVATPPPPPAPPHIEPAKHADAGSGELPPPPPPRG